MEAVAAETTFGRANGSARLAGITDASALLANGALSASQAVTSGDSFPLPALDINIRYQ